jgi:uncharacterized protein YaaQ
MQDGPKSVTLQYSLILTRMHRLRPASQSAERYHSLVSFPLNTEVLIPTIFVNSVNNKEICNVFSALLNNQLTD